ncbi:hypothetical protein FN846DRAFT_733881 [Sphaerosporella brunnea]|uniref:Uncharacterized protein n=1 Tax=Sphaerosporella brunnea TaxID=1250544 RepID=A0A5J5EVX3_9PEZI|nr:hypothetical protein FN846DRAFT_733881 [Sphaerosporella brunnea]
MTAVSPLPAAFTPPASSHGKITSEESDWEFSVPIDGGESFQGPQSHGFRQRNYVSDQHLGASPMKSDRINGYSNSPGNGYDIRTAGQTGDDGRHYSDFLAAPRAHLLSKHDSIVSSNHDGDSVLDLYGPRMSMISSAAHDDASSHAVPGESIYVNGNGSKAPDPEASNWIHRDKLARIEGNEAADYLFDVGKSRWIHKDKLERIEIEELQRAGEGGRRSQIVSTQRVEDENSDHKEEQHQVSSPIGSDDDDDEEIRGPDFYDFRTPEEQAADNQSDSPRKSFRRNRSYSRIPVASVSPHPIPQQFIERTTPLPRTSVTPNGSDDGGATTSPLRKRSHSAASAMLLDDQENPLPSVSGSNVNSKTRGVPSPTPRSKMGSRAGSVVGKQRTPQSGHRPGTSASYSAHSGNGAPGSSKSPEGQPPWALTGYKPDPSLPPDQQIIPTHAKRMQQDQWERDGIYATVYDKDLRPLKVDNGETEKTPSNKAENAEAPVEEWPLRSSVAPEPSAQMQEPSSDGGYRTMPTVQSNLSHEAAASSPPIKQMPVADDENDKKRKFCCCIIM